MKYLKLNNNLYPAEFYGKVHDSDWDNRPSKTIHVNMDFGTAMELFRDGTHWAIVQNEINEHGEVVTVEYDNSDYSVAGDITDHRDGTVSVKMGKPTAEEELTADLEQAYELLYGGN